MENNNPFFSIIIPTYNRDIKLNKAIKSVIDQSYCNWELIVVDDGSTDSTKDVVKSYKDKRIRYHWQKNKELSGARNAGIELAKATYVSFLDDDDAFEEDHLIRVKEVIDQHTNEICIYKTGLILCYNGKENRIKLFESDIIHPVTYLSENVCGMHSLIFHRDIFEYHGFREDQYLFEDEFFLYNVFLDYKVYSIPFYTACYFKHEESRTIQYAVINEKIQSYNAAITELIQSKETELRKYIHGTRLEFMKSSHYLTSAISAVKLGRKKMGIRLFAKGFKFEQIQMNYIFTIRFIFYLIIK